jgi:pimeloyl-ACP methyl ester carboxylesterase
MSGRDVAGAGARLSVAEHGPVDAPAVVFIHGYPDTSAVWDLVVDELADRFHTVTYDVRGAGRSEVPRRRDEYRLELLMGDLAAVLDAVSPTRPVHLVGHDWGSLQGWEAVTDPALAGRIAGCTSISGPSLDHVATWVRERARRHSGRALRDLAGQALRSSYIAAFHLPGAPSLAGMAAWRDGWGRRTWAKGLERNEHAQVDERWPAPTFASDLANGMNLYRANIGPKLRRGQIPRTQVPVQLLVPTGDRFVPPSLLDGLERASTRTWRRELPAGHWAMRSHPHEVTRCISELIEHIEGGDEAPELAAAGVG